MEKRNRRREQKPMIAYLSKLPGELYWDLLFEDGRREKLIYNNFLSRDKALQWTKEKFNDHDIELADYKDSNYKAAMKRYELVTGFPYSGREA